MDLYLIAVILLLVYISIRLEGIHKTLKNIQELNRQRTV